MTISARNNNRKASVVSKKQKAHKQKGSLVVMHNLVVTNDGKKTQKNHWKVGLLNRFLQPIWLWKKTLKKPKPIENSQLPLLNILLKKTSSQLVQQLYTIKKNNRHLLVLQIFNKKQSLFFEFNFLNWTFLISFWAVSLNNISKSWPIFIL